MIKKNSSTDFLKGIRGSNDQSNSSFNNLGQFGLFTSTFFMDDEIGTMQKERPTIELQADIIRYLQNLTADREATPIDIERELGISLLGKDNRLFDIIKYNPKVVSREENGETYFKYKAKFDIHNKEDLLNEIDRVKSGIARSDVRDCYQGIHEDIDDMIRAGELVACMNNREREIRGEILFPRKRPFIVELSGTVTAIPGKDTAETSIDFQPEIRRGDAIRINNTWYRVDCSLDGRRAHNQPERAKPPKSVTSNENIPGHDRNQYLKPFNERIIPLDSVYDDTSSYVGVAMKHGCTNDVREMWHGTVEKLKNFRSGSVLNEKALEAELIRLGLLTRQGTALMQKGPQSRVDPNARKKIKRSHRTKDIFKTNAHLIGTELGKSIMESNE
jgi:hypothetical protein